MEDAVLVLAMLFVLVMSSFMLDRYACMIISQSGFALVFGLVVGLLLLVTGKRESLSHHLNLDNTLFFDVLLPPIIYEGGFSIKRQAFFRNFPAIMSTAVLGTVIATCITGGVLYFAGQIGAVTALSWVEAFLFGALISAVDPVATLACFNKLNAPPLLFNLVFGESVLNDAVAIALYQTLLKWKPNIDLNAHELLLVAANTGGMFVGSLLVSSMITLLGAFLLKRKMFATLRHFPTYEISLCLIFSLLTYFVADSLNLSGIVSLFFSGTMTAHYHFHTISKAAQHSFTHLLHTTAFICENIVYVFMGTSVIMLFAGHVDKDAGTALRVDDIDWKFIVLTLAACLVARFFNIFPLLGLSNCFRSTSEKISTKYMTAIWFAGLRGSIAFALAKNWSYIGLKGASHRKLIESTTLMVVLFTTIVVGGLTGPFLSILGLVNKDKKDDVRAQLESDTGSSTDGTVSPAAPRLQTRHVPRRSMHYIVSQGNGENQTPFVEVPTSESTVTTMDMLRPEVVLTPRPQMLDSSSDSEDDDRWGESRTTTQPPAIQRATSNSSRESITGAFFRSWQAFDASRMQPIFGGAHSQAQESRASMVALPHLQQSSANDDPQSITLREITKIRKENLVVKRLLLISSPFHSASAAFCVASCYAVSFQLTIALERVCSALYRAAAAEKQLENVTSNAHTVDDERATTRSEQTGRTIETTSMTRHESDAHAQNGEVDDDDVQQQQRLKRVDGEEEEGSGNDNQREGEEDEEEDLSFMPPVEELENLILEAYNNMQSDGEFIFLPDEVAQRLHQVAQMMQEANAGLEDDGDNQQNQSDAEDAGDAISDDETGASQSTESLQENDLQEPEEEDEERQEREQEQAIRPPVKAPKQPFESKFMELPPVLEIDEEGSSDSHAGSPATEREIMNASPPPPPNSGSRRKTSSIPPPPPSHAPVPASPMKTSTKSASSPSAPSRLRAPRVDTKVASYESRREAAQKLREDKALREQRARDSAKKQREDARRKLEEAHQRQLEEKRERVRRMRTQREGVKPVASRKSPSSTGSTGK